MVHWAWVVDPHWSLKEGRGDFLLVGAGGRLCVEKGSIPLLCHLCSATQLPGALSSRLPSATAALVTQSPERSTLLWWQKQMPMSPHGRTQPFLPESLALTISSFSLTQGRSLFHHCCLPPPAVPRPLQQRAGSCVVFTAVPGVLTVPSLSCSSHCLSPPG